MQNRLASLSLVAAVMAGLLALVMLYLPAQAAANQTQKNNDDNGNGEDRVQTIDDLFAQVAKQHPGFGGMFIDEKKGITYVFLPDGKSKEAKAVVNDLEDVLDRDLPNRAKALPAKYSFLELKRWHDRMEGLFQIPRVTLTDIDDAKNLLTVGVANSETKALVDKQLAKLDVPTEAVNIEEIGPFQRNQAPQQPPQCSATTLSPKQPVVLPITPDQVKPALCRPLVGGLHITFFEPTIKEQIGCTLGVIAEHAAGVGGGTADDDVEGFVTASHCSTPSEFANPPAPVGGVHGTVYCQPFGVEVKSLACGTIQIGGQIINLQIGKETIDPTFTSCPVPIPPPAPGEPNATCRKSDSLFAQLDEGVSEEGLGYIARPKKAQKKEKGVLCKDKPKFCKWNGKRTFRITAEGQAMVGDIVTKIGAATGRTQGKVLETGARIDYPGPVVKNRFLQNQVVTDYASVKGDSGAPVIDAQAPDPKVNPVDTSLLGIHWGLDPKNEKRHVFSPISGVEADLGPLNTCAPPIEC